MNKLNLKATTPNETIIIEYLERNASDALIDRINAGTKTLAQCWNYITSEAKKKVVNGCACIEDITVFGWATHFFEEDAIAGNKFNKKTGGLIKDAVITEQTKTPETSVPPKKEKKPAPKPQEQFSFEDLFGGFDDESCEN